MPPATVIVPLHKLMPNQQADFFALLVEKNPGTTRDGKPYFACKFRDRHRAVAAMIWADSPLYASCAEGWHIGTYWKLRAVYGESERYGLQVNLLQARPVQPGDTEDGFREADCHERSSQDPDLLFARLRELGEKEIADGPLRGLVLALLDTHRDALLKLPAHRSRFYPYPGGWLEHVVRVVEHCLYLVDRYRAIYTELQPPLNRDAVVAGAILHDIGRVRDFALSAIPGQPPEPTVPGELFGHLLLGRDMIRDQARDFPELDSELLMLVEHIVYSHLALPAWGSPRLPAAPEVLILHHADDLDAKMEMFARCLMRDTAEGPLTERDPQLGKPLWKRTKA